MPTPSFGSLNQDATNEQIIDYIYKLEKELNYLLLSLDTTNVNRLDAKVIKTGILDANLVTVRSDLTTGYVQIDSNGLRANNGTINTFEIDVSGSAYFRGDITSDATITGASIIGASITGGNINVSSNVTIGQYLYFPIAGSGGVIFPNASIYFNDLTDTLELGATNGISVNNLLINNFLSFDNYTTNPGGTAPTNITGYLPVSINGTSYEIPFY